jgi:uncharacterized phage protein (TIGR01671 family)
MEMVDLKHRPQMVLRLSGKVTEGSTTPNVVLEQFTGLLDRNGKDIYEGDILISARTKAKFIVEYLGGGFIQHPIEFDTLSSKDPSDYIYWEWNELEIIGNIHENPELLENKVDNETD